LQSRSEVDLQQEAGFFQSDLLHSSKMRVKPILGEVLANLHTGQRGSWRLSHFKMWPRTEHVGASATRPIT